MDDLKTIVRQVVGGINRIHHGNANSKDTSPTPTKTLLKDKPIVRYQYAPDQIIARELKCAEGELKSNDDYQGIARALIGFRKSGGQWEDVRKKIPAELLDMMTRIFREARRNGFIAPIAYRDGKGYRIKFAQVVENPNCKKRIDATLCDFCERDCMRKDARGVFPDGAVRCWQK